MLDQLWIVIYAECHTQAINAEYHYAECCYAECRGALPTAICIFFFAIFSLLVSAGLKPLTLGGRGECSTTVQFFILIF